MQLNGIKKNKCFLAGVQGVVNTVVSENTSGQSANFALDGPENNTLYVVKQYLGGTIGLLPENPTADYNFKITIQNTTGFIGTLAGFISFYNAPTTEAGEEITIKWDNPDFDVTDGWTVIHVHIWFDGINYCGKIDGYV